MPSSPASQSDFVRELQRLHQAHLAALHTKDPEQIDEAVEALTLFLRYSNAGRLPEYFASRRSVGDGRGSAAE
jgi:hypothetical protein